MNGVAGLVLWAGAMGDWRAPGRRLSAGARAGSPPTLGKRELLLSQISATTSGLATGTAADTRTGCGGAAHRTGFE